MPSAATPNQCRRRAPFNPRRSSDLSLQELREDTDGPLIVPRQLGSMGAPRPPEGVEAQVLQIHVGREALAGVGDGAVPRAAAEVARHRTLRLGRREPGGPLGRRRPPLALGLGACERGGEGHAHPGRAEAALRGVEPREALVHGVAAAEPLGGGDRAVVEPVHQRQAGARRGVRHRARRRVVGGEQHHARAAPACGTGPSSSSSKNP